MAGRILRMAIKRSNAFANFSCPKANASNTRAFIGKREIVGYGFNGQPNYVDRPDFPMPAIRWKEPNSDVMVRK